MTKKMNTLDYPVVIKQVHGYITVSVPDLGISEKFKPDFKIDQEATLSPEVKQFIFKCYCHVLNLAEHHVQNKSWLPDPSAIKQQIEKPQKDMSLPEFTKELNRYISISENTIRREISRGKIIAITTHGGHRRIPETEVSRYVQQLKNEISL